MSTWHVIARERLGTPATWWASPYGPTEFDAAATRTLDLTPFLHPLENLQQTLERDLMRASLGQISLDLMDADGSLAEQLGPTSTVLATASRYCGPWIEVWERWPGGEALRFTGYVDEASIEWDAQDTLTQVSVYHASQLLRERKLADLDEFLRPYPRVPTVATQTFEAVSAEFLLYGITNPTADAAEAVRWATGRLSWTSQLRQGTERAHSGPGRPSIEDPEAPDLDPGEPVYYGLPAIPSQTIKIGSTVYVVDHLAWSTVELVTPSASGSAFPESVEGVVEIVLVGSPDLSGVLSIGTLVSWGIAEQVRTHYVLAADVPAPASGQEGQRFLKLTTVDQLVAGDTLTIAYVQDGKSETMEVQALDVDGETGQVLLRDSVDTALGIAAVRRIRRESRNPVLADGLELARVAVAPWTLDTSQLLPAVTSWPVLTWLPHDQASPHTYGVTDVQALDRAGHVRLARRGGIDSVGASKAAGCWEGTSSGWAWTGLGSPEVPSLPLHQVGQRAQWPGGTNDTAPPTVWIDGDLSGGATIPPNGWRRMARSWKSPILQLQDAQATWDGTDVSWEPATASGDVPSILRHFAAQTVAPGAFQITAGPVFKFQPHSGPGALGTQVTITPSGALPGGNFAALGMGAWSSSGAHQEALLGLVVSGASPWSGASAVLLSAGASGALTVEQTAALTLPSAGTWALGGGLVVGAYQETISGAVYPHTRLWLVDGDTLQADFPTLEILPGTIQPLALASGRISGWWALGLETYTDEDGQARRRSRFLVLDAQLQLLNGISEPSPADPVNPAANFRRGDLLSDPVPSGSMVARAVRTGEGDRCLGILGGRLFQVDSQISPVLEQIKTDQLDVIGFLEQLGQTLMATARPRPDGGVDLVSRRAGVLRGPVAPSVEGDLRTRPVGLWVGTVNVTYTDILQNSTETVTATATRSGGKVLDLDLSAVLAGPAQANAIARAAAYQWGGISPVRACTWNDGALGLASGLAPTWWADWAVGDRVQTGGKVYKLTKLEPGLEARTAEVELLEVPGGGA